MQQNHLPSTSGKWQVHEAYQAIKVNAGSAGVDRQSLEAFEQDLKGNLYKIWIGAARFFEGLAEKRSYLFVH